MEFGDFGAGIGNFGAGIGNFRAGIVGLGSELGISSLDLGILEPKLGILWLKFGILGMDSGIYRNSLFFFFPRAFSNGSVENEGQRLREPQLQRAPGIQVNPKNSQNFFSFPEKKWEFWEQKPGKTQTWAPKHCFFHGNLWIFGDPNKTRVVFPNFWGNS